MQFSALMALRMVTRQLGRLERNPTFLHASDEYMRSAESIAQRLHREIPNLLAHASTTYTSVQSEDTRDAPLPPHDAVVPVGL